jgi:glutamyl-tRNA reductase
MRCAVIGMSHKTASLPIREALTQVCGDLFDPKTALLPEGSFVLLSTCNRIEIYFSSRDLASTHTWILNRIRSHLDMEFEPYLYAYFGRDAFKHLADVISGVDSALLGESEIQGQVKRAYEEAHQFSFLSSDLHYMFQKGLHIGKKLRTHLSQHKEEAALSKILREHIQEVFPETSSFKVLFVGYSRINLSIYNSLSKLQVTFCNRTEKKLESLTLKGVGILPWKEREKWVDYDIVFFGTHSGKYLASAQDLLKAPKKRRGLFDLSVPRNVDPKVGYFQETFLWNLEQLHSQMQVGLLKEKKEWRSLTESLIEDHIERYINLFNLKKLRCRGSEEMESRPEYFPYRL